VSDGIEEAVAIDEPTPSFVDGLWLHLQAAVSPLAEKRLAAFARQRGVTKWIIATDFCIRDKSRPNDSFAFVIFPAGQKLEADNRYLFVFRIAFHAVDNQCRCEIRHVAIRSRPVGPRQQGRRNRLGVTPLQKRSRQLT
jgi:hypothetical protein